jgi:hypothetical protein
MYGGGPSIFSRGAEEKTKTRRTYLHFFEISRSDFKNNVTVFSGYSCRETAKNAIKYDRKKGFCFLTFSAKQAKVFDMCFPQNFFYGVFELPWFRNSSRVAAPAATRAGAVVVEAW